MGSCSTPCSLESLLLHGSNVEKAHACPSLTSTLLRSFSAQALQEYWDMNPDLEAELRDLWREDPEAVEASRWCVCVSVCMGMLLVRPRNTSHLQWFHFACMETRWRFQAALWPQHRFPSYHVIPIDVMSLGPLGGQHIEVISMIPTCASSSSSMDTRIVPLGLWF